MSHSYSVKLRLLISVGVNILRAGVGFLTGLLIARTLDSDGYGDFMFLLGSFMAIRSLLDMGSSSAFFTFLSKRERGSRFYLFYFTWLAFQFIVMLVLVGLILPASVIDRIWLGHNREVVLLAFVAAFMQQQIWQTVMQIGEARRETVKVQFINLAVAVAYLSVICLVVVFGLLSIKKILLIIIGQYIVAAIVAHKILRKAVGGSLVEQQSLRQILREYWQYCNPLVFLALVSFLYDFANKWMLQKFGGATEQGYFQIANQFAAVSILVTTSILNVFWKEIAYSWEINDSKAMSKLYCRVNRGALMLGACASGLLLPWTEEIVHIFLGPSFIEAWPVLAIMLLYPIHQSMGQIGGTMMLATGQTNRFMFVSVATMLIAIPTMYFVLAPSKNMLLPGLEMGAFGMALQVVVLGIASVNIQAWVLARYGGWRYDWAFQALGIPLMIGLGFLAKTLILFFCTVTSFSLSNLVIPVILYTFVYISLVAWTLWQLPWLIGSDRRELHLLLNKTSGIA